MIEAQQEAAQRLRWAPRPPRIINGVYNDSAQPAGEPPARPHSMHMHTRAAAPPHCLPTPAPIPPVLRFHRLRGSGAPRLRELIAFTDGGGVAQGSAGALTEPPCAGGITCLHHVAARGGGAALQGCVGAAHARTRGRSWRARALVWRSQVQRRAIIYSRQLCILSPHHTITTHKQTTTCDFWQSVV